MPTNWAAHCKVKLHQIFILRSEHSFYEMAKILRTNWLIEIFWLLFLGNSWALWPCVHWLRRIYRPLCYITFNARIRDMPITQNRRSMHTNYVEIKSNRTIGNNRKPKLGIQEAVLFVVWRVCVWCAKFSFIYDKPIMAIIEHTHIHVRTHTPPV